MTRSPAALLAALALAAALTGCGSQDPAPRTTPESTPKPTAETSAPPSPTPTAPSPTSPSPTAPAPAPPAVEAFVAYAGGGADRVPWADRVRFTVAGEEVATFGPEDAGRRETWQGCPAGTATYEGRDCPVSPLRSIAGLAGIGATTVLESAAPRVVGCTRYRAPVVPGSTTTWVRPDRRHRSCFDDLAVAVSVDGAGRVVAVDLALSGP